MPHHRMFICQECACVWEIPAERHVGDRRLSCPKCGSDNIHRKIPISRAWVSSVWRKIDRQIDDGHAKSPL